MPNSTSERERAVSFNTRRITRLSFLRLGAIAAGAFALKPYTALAKAFTMPSNPFRDQDVNHADHQDSDIIPRDVLKQKYNIEILDLADQQKFIKLNFRIGFEDDPISQQIVEYMNGTLRIVLLNGPYFDAKFLTQQQLAQDLELPKVLWNSRNNTLAENLSTYRSEKDSKIVEYEGIAEKLKRQLSTGEIDQDRYNISTQRYKEAFSIYFRDPSDEDLLLLTGGTFAKYVNSGGGYIFLNMIKPVKVFSSGNVSEEITFSGLTNLDPRQSYPSPNRFSVDYSAKEYIIKNGHTLATHLQHELEHAAGLRHPLTDHAVLGRITSADYNLRSSGNDKQYWIKFEIPEGVVVSGTAPLDRKGNNTY